jgi:hypothetical protein
MSVEIFQSIDAPRNATAPLGPLEVKENLRVELEASVRPITNQDAKPKALLDTETFREHERSLVTAPKLGKK